MYVQSIHFCFDQISWMALLWNLTLNVHISLWDLRTRRSNWAARLGLWTQLLERHLLPTEILQTILKLSFQPRQLRNRRKKMQGHIVGTGVSVPSPLQAKCFGKAGAWRPQVEKWAKLEGDTAKGRVSFCYSSAQQFISLKPFLYCPFNVCAPTDTEQKARRQVNKIILICKQTNLYTGCSRWFTISLNCIISTTKIAEGSFCLFKHCYSSAPSVHN